MGIPEKSLIQGDAVLELIPQRSPVVMIDTVYEPTESSTFTGLLIKEDNIFCKNGYLQESGIVEHIAQSAAARIGYFCKLNNTVPPVGFIGAVKNLKINFLPVAGSVLYTEIKLLHDVMECNIISGLVLCNNQQVAECEMKVFIQK
jgi:hypothetical protein